VVLTEWNLGRQAEKGIGAMFNNSVEILEHAIAYAKKQGIRVRREMLDGTTSGLCRIGNAPCIFLDQSSTADQQLTEIMRALQSESSKAEEKKSRTTIALQ
jgi:hypothetical protein